DRCPVVALDCPAVALGCAAVALDCPAVAPVDPVPAVGVSTGLLGHPVNRIAVRARPTTVSGHRKASLIVRLLSRRTRGRRRCPESAPSRTMPEDSQGRPIHRPPPAHF